MVKEEAKLVYGRKQVNSRGKKGFIGQGREISGVQRHTGKQENSIEGIIGKGSKREENMLKPLGEMFT